MAGVNPVDVRIQVKTQTANIFIYIILYYIVLSILTPTNNHPYVDGKTQRDHEDLENE